MQCIGNLCGFGIKHSISGLSIEAHGRVEERWAEEGRARGGKREREFGFLTCVLEEGGRRKKEKRGFEGGGEKKRPVARSLDWKGEQLSRKAGHWSRRVRSQLSLPSITGREALVIHYF